MFSFFSSPTCLTETVPRVSIPILEGLASLAVENRILPMYLTRFRTTGLCRLAMFAIDAERKVCPHQNYLIKTYRSWHFLSRPLDTRLSYKQRSRVWQQTTDKANNGYSTKHAKSCRNPKQWWIDSGGYGNSRRWLCCRPTRFVCPPSHFSGCFLRLLTFWWPGLHGKNKFHDRKAWQRLKFEKKYQPIPC